MAEREQPRREQSERRTGLVLEGGGMRGIYTAGILDVFMEAGVHFDGVIGVSAGAIHGCSFVSGQRGRSIRYYKKYCNDRRFMSFFNVITTGDIAREDFCYHKIPEELDPYDFEAFERSGTEFYVGCSNVETGRPEYIRIRDMRRDIDDMRVFAISDCFQKNAGAVEKAMRLVKMCGADGQVPCIDVVADDERS